MKDHYLEIYDLLLFRATAILGNPEEAKDVVQEGYLRAAVHDANGLPVHNVRGYLYGMVSNMARAYLRQQKRHADIEQAMALPEAREPEPCGDPIEEVLAPLSELQRRVVQLHDIEGYTCPEIALRLKRTTGAVKKQLALAHRALKGIYHQKEYGQH